jgi:hypothetical protein
MDSLHHRHPIHVESAETASSVARQLAEGLVAYNEAHAGPRNTQEFTLSARDSGGTLIEGLTAELF